MRGQTPMLEFMGLFGVSTGECARFVRLFERSDPGLTGAIDVPFFFASLHLDYNALAAAAFGLFEPEATADVPPATFCTFLFFAAALSASILAASSS